MTSTMTSTMQRREQNKNCCCYSIAKGQRTLCSSSRCQRFMRACCCSVSFSGWVDCYASSMYGSLKHPFCDVTQPFVLNSKQGGKQAAERADGQTITPRKRVVRDHFRELQLHTIRTGTYHTVPIPTACMHALRPGSSAMLPLLLVDEAGVV